MSRRSKKQHRVQRGNAKTRDLELAAGLGQGAPEWAPGFWSRRDWVFALFLVAAVVIAYQPVWHAGFIWDDDHYVVNNPLLTAPDGLWRIWFSYDSPSQYFPLIYTTFRVERALWGLSPLGYHCVNVLFHCANALLLWRLLLRLEIPGAALAAAIFALHPVQVESVAWVTELKNVQMGFFFLLSVLAWTRFTGPGNERAWRFYAVSLVFYALALCSKTTACTLPAALLLIVWLRGERIGGRRLLEVAPFVAMGIGMGTITVFWERYHQGTQGKMFSLGLVERVLVASRAVWFYLGKLVWPDNLIFSYPHWAVSRADPLAYGWPLALIILAGVMVFAGRFVGRGAWAALIFFVATLSPVLGFIMLYTFRYSYVADHYQYLACIGPIALFSAGIEGLQRRYVRSIPLVIPGLCAVLLVSLGVLTWRQSGTYRDMETLWRTTIARNPESSMAHGNLSILLLQQGRVDEAVTEAREAVRLEPDITEVHADLGNALLVQGRVEEAIVEFREAVRISPDLAEAYYNLGNALFQNEQPNEAIAQLREAIRLNPEFANAYYNLGVVHYQMGEVPKAIVNIEKALQLEPANLAAQAKLAWILAAAPQTAFRDGDRAVKLATQACESTGEVDPLLLRTLAAAYAQDGQFSDAVQTANKAIQLAGAQSNEIVANALRREIKLYEAGQAYRDQQ